jgi:hypothetical protein
LYQIPQGARRVKGGDLQAIRTPFDFSGAIKPIGRGIFFDAKHIASTDKHLSFHIGPPLVKSHQITALVRMGEAGALAGLVVSCGPSGDIRWLDWRHLREGACVPWDCGDWIILSKTDDPIGFGKLLAMNGLRL